MYQPDVTETQVHHMQKTWVRHLLTYQLHALPPTRLRLLGGPFIPGTVLNILHALFNLGLTTIP